MNRMENTMLLARFLRCCKVSEETAKAVAILTREVESEDRLLDWFADLKEQPTEEEIKQQALQIALETFEIEE